jgi:predicted enzyme related to lactoylglutathione lyase
MGKIMHFELGVDDLDRAKTFYSTVFGWKLDTSDMPGGGQYTSIITTDVDPQTMTPTEPGAINGGMVPRSEAVTPAPVVTIGVDGIDAALDQVEAAGGKTVTPRTEIPGMGAYAYFADVEGNVMGLWENASG